MTLSKSNNWNAPLARFGFPGDVFDGVGEPTGTAAAISVNILASTQCTLTIQQSYNSTNWYNQQQYTIIPGQLQNIQMRAVLPNFRVALLNEEMVNQTYCSMNTSLVPQLTQNFDIRPLNSATDSVSVGNLPAEQLVTGENANFEFYPTAANNTAAIYADETQGTTVTGGWQYANINNSGKINWYCYSSPGVATDYKVSQLTSMYTVINQQSTLGLATAQNPWVMIYTRPNGVNDSAAWYKSKLFFGSNAHTDILGVKLLYTGTDPVGVHPEITGINRIQLLFVSALSNNKQLADVQNENIMLGSLQTTNATTPANSFFFTMQEFGCDWVKTPAVLPIEFGRVLCDISGQSVTMNGTVTTDISGQYVNISTMPHLSKTIDSVDISGQTVLIGGAIACDISGQHVIVSSTPYLSKITSSVDISGQHVVVSGTVATDISGQHVIVSSTPYLSKATSSVDISGQTVVLGSGNNVVGKVLTFENPSSVISLTGVNNTGQTIKTSPGSLFNLTCFNDGNAVSYVKLYNVAVPIATDTPVMTLPILHDSPINTISVHNYQFTTAIGIRATAAYAAADITAPNGTTSVTAFYNGVSP